MKLDYEKFLGIFKNADRHNVDETTFYFDDDPDEQEHYLGWIGGQEKPYWVGYCDIHDGCEYSSAEEMFTAKIYEGRSLKERWEQADICTIGGIDAETWLSYYEEVMR
ncbi:MAG: hypothetical protein J5582_10640 [Ruminococcus sp.]|uniref:hypothetical protein n=1 Tax=Ruminococcus sp. TaxID=41978 RepID=UPI0025FD0B76|nr:hypothetical protein [Ruminococcus sp.]MBO4866997.1 hypothetical protein [Ruminococcus sp.]